MVPAPLLPKVSGRRHTNRASDAANSMASAAANRGGRYNNKPYEYNKKSVQIKDGDDLSKVIN